MRVNLVHLVEQIAAREIEDAQVVDILATVGFVPNDALREIHKVQFEASKMLDKLSWIETGLATDADGVDEYALAQVRITQNEYKEILKAARVLGSCISPYVEPRTPSKLSKAAINHMYNNYGKIKVAKATPTE